MNNTTHKLLEIDKYSGMAHEAKGKAQLSAIISGLSVGLLGLDLVYVIACDVPEALFWAGVLGISSAVNHQKSKNAQHVAKYYEWKAKKLERDFYKNGR